MQRQNIHKFQLHAVQSKAGGEGLLGVRLSNVYEMKRYTMDLESIERDRHHSLLTINRAIRDIQKVLQEIRTTSGCYREGCTALGSNAPTCYFSNDIKEHLDDSIKRARRSQEVTELQATSDLQEFFSGGGQRHMRRRCWPVMTRVSHGHWRSNKMPEVLNMGQGEMGVTSEEAERLSESSVRFSKCGKHVSAGGVSAELNAEGAPEGGLMEEWDQRKRQLALPLLLTPPAESSAADTKTPANPPPCKESSEGTCRKSEFEEPPQPQDRTSGLQTLPATPVVKTGTSTKFRRCSSPVPPRQRDHVVFSEEKALWHSTDKRVSGRRLVLKKTCTSSMEMSFKAAAETGDHFQTRLDKGSYITRGSMASVGVRTRDKRRVKVILTKAAIQRGLDKLVWENSQHHQQPGALSCLEREKRKVLHARVSTFIDGLYAHN